MSFAKPAVPAGTLKSSHFAWEGALDSDGKWYRMQHMVTKEPQLSMSPEELRWSDCHWHRSFVRPGTSSTSSSTFAPLRSVTIPTCWTAAGSTAAAATTAAEAAPSCTAHVPHAHFMPAIAGNVPSPAAAASPFSATLPAPPTPTYFNPFDPAPLSSSCDSSTVAGSHTASSQLGTPVDTLSTVLAEWKEKMDDMAKVWQRASPLLAQAAAPAGAGAAAKDTLSVLSAIANLTAAPTVDSAVPASTLSAPAGAGAGAAAKDAKSGSASLTAVPSSSSSSASDDSSSTTSSIASSFSFSSWNSGSSSHPPGWPAVTSAASHPPNAALTSTAALADSLCPSSTQATQSTNAAASSISSPAVTSNLLPSIASAAVTGAGPATAKSPLPSDSAVELRKPLQGSSCPHDQSAEDTLAAPAAAAVWVYFQLEQPAVAAVASADPEGTDAPGSRLTLMQRLVSTFLRALPTTQPLVAPAPAPVPAPPSSPVPPPPALCVLGACTGLNLTVGDVAAALGLPRSTLVLLRPNPRMIVPDAPCHTDHTSDVELPGYTSASLKPKTDCAGASSGYAPADLPAMQQLVVVPACTQVWELADVLPDYGSLDRPFVMVAPHAQGHAGSTAVPAGSPVSQPQALAAGAYVRRVSATAPILAAAAFIAVAVALSW